MTEVSKKTTRKRQPKKKEMKFYSLAPLLEKKATYNIIFGERSNGKTYAALKHGIETYFETGGEFALVRRWKEDITGARASRVFAALNAAGEVTKISNGQYAGIHYWSGRFYLCNYDEDTGKAIYNDGDIIGHTFALSDNEHDKSISFPRVENIIFDEFLTKNVHLQDEFVLFMNTVSTIVRQRTNVQVFMLGNTVNTYSPYFKEMGLRHVLKMEQGEIAIYRYGDSDLTVAVEYCTSNEETKPNNFYFAFDNPKLNMITSGAWELDMYPHAPMKFLPKDIMFEYFIVFDNSIYQCKIVSIGEATFTFIHDKTTPIKDVDSDLIYTFEYVPKMNYNRNIFKPINKLQQKVLWYFEKERVYYQDNTVGNAIGNYLKVCRQSMM